MSIRSVILNFLWPYRRNQSRTIRYAFPMLAIVAALLGASAVSTSQQSSVRLEAVPSTVEAGKPFSVQVFVSAHVPVNAVTINVNVPSNVKVTGIDTGESVITLWTRDPYVEGRTVVLSGGTFRKGFVGEHLIATINAEATASGIGEFTVRDVMLLAGDGSGTKVTVDKAAGGAKLYIANADGSFATPQDVAVDGATAVIVVTDIDGDGDVSLTDVSRFMSAWSSNTLVYDFNSDGRMTFRDFGIILSDVFFK
jgi:hypothetical protein